MKNIAELINLTDTLTNDPVTRYDAYQLLADRIGMPRQALKMNMHQTVVEDLALQYQANLEELLAGKPLHRILGYRYFWKDKFALSLDTLEPRPDTETLIEVCLKHVPNTKANYNILDLGTGSGCIILSLLREYVNAVGWGVDISENALETAKHNADQLNLSERVRWVHSNWIDNIQGKFDIIISNPPYIPSVDISTLTREVQMYDPLRALDGGTDGLEAYRHLAGQLPAIMLEHSLIILEIGYDQEESVPELFKKAGYTLVDLIKDYGNNPRCVVLRK